MDFWGWRSQLFDSQRHAQRCVVHSLGLDGGKCNRLGMGEESSHHDACMQNTNTLVGLSMPLDNAGFLGRVMSYVSFRVVCEGSLYIVRSFPDRRDVGVLILPCRWVTTIHETAPDLSDGTAAPAGIKEVLSRRTCITSTTLAAKCRPTFGPVHMTST